MDRNPPLDEAAHVTFNVPNSWKGVDTKRVTIRTGDRTSCGFYRFEQGQEYLAYGAKNISAIDLTLCGCTATIDSSPFVNLDLQFLENRNVPIGLMARYTMGINLFPIITTVGNLVAISVAAFGDHKTCLAGVRMELVLADKRASALLAYRFVNV